MGNSVKQKVADGNQTFADMDCNWWDPENREVDGRYFTLTWMFESVEEKIKSGKGKIACDVGAGRGRYSKLLQDKGYGVYACDINIAMLDIIKRRGLTDKLYQADAESLPFRDESFDLVTAMDLTMHVNNTEKLLSELYRILKKDGELFTNISNANSIYAIWTKKINPKLKALQSEYLRKNFTPKEFKTLLGEIGFTIINENGHGVVSPLSLKPEWEKMVMPVNFAKYMSKNLGLDDMLGAKYGHVIDYHVRK